MGDVYIKDKSKEQLVSDLMGTAMPGSVVHEQQKMAIVVRSVQDIELAIDAHANAIRGAIEATEKIANSLDKVNTILNAVRMIAAMVMVALAIITVRAAIG